MSHVITWHNHARRGAGDQGEQTLDRARQGTGKATLNTNQNANKETYELQRRKWAALSHVIITQHGGRSMGVSKD